MRYPKEHYAVNVNSLSEDEARFYKNALRYYRRKPGWWAFYDFAFGPYSVMYEKTQSHHRVIGTPMYEALKAMWLQLGIAQGEVRVDKPKHAARRK
jgi:hypothetical protein